ncbi:MAG: 2OG-Fe(II) oxygenase [Gammaproteobacteria bacterium]|jgi:Rps23 Pro-64 3,4-dihydroxylase Tpa1-like proline 4-hydroxylase|nr:2OG-Fe(II) oxygenase [Gammaproteobacteria bacterium]
MIRYEQLGDPQALRETFRNAEPTPHLVLDGFLEPAVAERAAEAFPTLAEMDALNDIRQRKAQDPDIGKFHPVFSEIIFGHLHDSRLMDWIEQVSGIRHLLADRQLYASGLAQGGDGSELHVHLDNSSHPVQPWYRRLNLIIYLNRDWTPEKGGQLELWSPDMRKSVQIEPIFNRALLFATSKTSWHGYRRVNTPDGDSRKSINLYYFSEASPTGQEYYHVTTFRGRPDEPLRRLLYPLDNALRRVARLFRRRKDQHAVLYRNR